jgi:hypothetical protein
VVRATLGPNPGHRIDQAFYDESLTLLAQRTAINDSYDRASAVGISQATPVTINPLPARTCFLDR